MESHFKGRTLAVVSDFSLDELVYTLEKTRQLEGAMAENDKPALYNFRIDDEDFPAYIIMLEPSTRTGESFRRAAKFSRIPVHRFSGDNSSFTKGESFADTFNTLTGYGARIFVVRSKTEGLCRWLEINGRAYAARNNLLAPAFINAGDGQHEHPTQEILDEYTFLQHNGWDRSHFHVALVGDLKHGRTVHSKVEGLRIFNEVEADLISPPELRMPKHYIARMAENGFSIREFSSLKEYFSQNHIAKSFYMTRLQLERMGQDIKEKEASLLAAVSFEESYKNLVPEGTLVFHPLPRKKGDSSLPVWLDETCLNGYERQSRNGYLTRIVLLAEIAGKIGMDFNGTPYTPRDYPDDFVRKLPVGESKIKEYQEGIRPIINGIAIDHICRGESYEQIWKHMAKVMEVLHLYSRGGWWVDQSQKNPGMYKGIISLPDCSDMDLKTKKRLAALAPGCRINKIRDRKVVEKEELGMPPRIYNFPELSCMYPDCISHYSTKEAPAVFYRQDNKENTFICGYCDKPHSFKDIWK